MPLEAVSVDAARTGGKAVVEKLLKVRRTLEGGESNYVTQINTCIEEIRAITKLSAHQKEELVLYAIERQGATTLKEIAEDARLSVDVTKLVLIELYKQDLIYQVKKYIPGSGRPNFMYKSRRVKSPEGD